MNIEKAATYTEITSTDENGEYLIRIHHDCTQVQIERDDDLAYFDCNHRELKAIRDAISEVLDGYDKFISTN